MACIFGVGMGFNYVGLIQLAFSEFTINKSLLWESE